MEAELPVRRKSMKKRFIKSMSFIFCLILLVGLSGTTASKAKSKNTIKVTLTVGKTYQLKVTGATKKLKWNTSNKKIATVSSKGKIKAKKAGKVKIYAKIGKKKLICYLTVKAKKTTKSKNVKPAATKKPVSTTAPIQTVWPGTTQAPVNSTAPIVSTGPVVTPAATVEPSATVQPTVAPTAQPEYTDGPKLEQTYHANLCFATDDYSYYEEGNGEYIKNSTNGFYCTDSLGNYIAGDSYKVNYQEVTIDHAGMYSFKIGGINNMLQNAKDFNALYITTDIGVNKGVTCKNLELYVDGTLITSVQNVNNRSSNFGDDTWGFWLRSIWSDYGIFDSSIHVPIPKESIEVRCYFDPGQTCNITSDEINDHYSAIKSYIYDEAHNDLTNYSEYNFGDEGIVFEDEQNVYVISCKEDSESNDYIFSQYDKSTKKMKSSMNLATSYGNMYIQYSTSQQIDLEGYVNATDVTSATNVVFYYENGIAAGSAINTEANQEFQRSLSAWNQLLQERLHMSLKDLGFLSYE